MNAVSGNIAIFVPHSGCPQQCSFCNQKTISGTQNPPTGEEAAQLCKDALAGLPTSLGQVEIAFFGGSFTAIPREYMMELLAAVQPYLSDSRVKGIRLSTRPDAIDRRRLDILQSYGVTAIELGAQSMDDRVLAMNRRGHTAQSVRDASALIKEYGFSLGLQMMTGLYGADEASDYATGLELCALSPDTVRIYPTVLLEGTQLAEEFRRGSYTPPTVEQTIPLCVRLLELFESRHIKIIRLGLQASETLSAQVLGGCYHPALGELCQGERYYNNMLAEIQQMG
ncbi:MAG: radical SAM protein, partial [Angelakisella sp.]